MTVNNAFKDFFGKDSPALTDSAIPKPDEKRVVGKLIKVSSEQGWGFISSKEVKFTRIFFHWTSLRQDTLKFQDLHVGMKVEFTPVEIEGKGTRAIKIKVLKDEPAKTVPPITTGTEAESIPSTEPPTE
jgi:cold shock CspA family protein